LQHFQISQGVAPPLSNQDSEKCSDDTSDPENKAAHAEELSACARFPGVLPFEYQSERTDPHEMFDPVNPSLTVASLGKVAAALGRKLEFKFVRVPGSPKRETRAKKKNQAIA